MDRQTWMGGASRLGVPLTNDQRLAMEGYVALLLKWNARFNLISRKDVGRIWPRHILDSLSVAPVLTELAGKMGVTALRAMDLGSGAGLPGVPLAIAIPESRWLLVDRNQRKVRFLELVVSELGLTNVRAMAADVGSAAGKVVTDGVDVVVSRAVEPPGRVAARCGHLLREGGALVLLSGAEADRGHEQEDESMPAGARFEQMAVRELVIPGLERTHEVTIIRARGEKAVAGSGV